MREELANMQYNISNSQALFGCFVHIIFRMDSLDVMPMGSLDVSL